MRNNSTLIALSVVDITALLVGLSVYLGWAGFLLTRIAGNLEKASDTVQLIVNHSDEIPPGIDHILRTGGVVAGALPLLYGMAEGIVTGVAPTPAPEDRPVRGPAKPASGRRRSRMHDSIGYSGGHR